ncbi:unnamed protein product [Echinostoma caproni]|uniref:Fibronectin type-III domain-containing protein n=1 Tax=Echinostoma caproni TaxID=27848 RepID=A0A183A6S6_9TREM|nr:unnamed protein product [Echinostoma caproni]
MEGKTLAIPRGSDTNSPDGLPIGGKLVEQKLQETVLERDQNLHLPEGAAINCAALRSTKCFLAFCMMLVQLLRVYKNDWRKLEKESARDVATVEQLKESTTNVLSPVQTKTDQFKTQTVLGEISNIQDISSRVKSALEREFPISMPIVKRVANFTTGIHLLWKIFDRNVAAQIVNFEIELRMLKSTTDRGSTLRIRRDAGVRAGAAFLPIEDGYWTLPSRVANAGLKNEICLTESKDIHPGRVYTARVVGVVRPQDQMEFTSEISVRSPWSERISFENLLNLQPTITTLLATNKTTFKLEWTLPTVSNWDLPPQLEIGAIYIHFHALLTPLLSDANSSHPQKSRWRTCRQEADHTSSIAFTRGDDGTRNNSDIMLHHMGQETFLGSWHWNGDNRDSKPFQWTIENLQPNTTYGVAIYGLLSPSKERSFEPDSLGWYTLISAEAIEQTLIEDNVEPKAKSEWTNKGVQKSENTNEAKIQSKTDYVDAKSPMDQESHVLVVILGSLAGVLLVISLALIGLCIWYHLRTKRLVYQEAVESPNKLGITTSSLELSSTPNGYLMNTANPVLNFMDSSYQAQFTGSPQMQHLGISNPGLRQLAELQSLCQLSGCPPPSHPPAWSTMPFSPGEKTQTQMLQQQQQQQHYPTQQSWLNADIPKASKSKAVMVSGLYSYGNGTPHSLESTIQHHNQHNSHNRHHHQSNASGQELDSLLCCDSDASDKAAHVNDAKREPFEAYIGGPDGNFSSPGISDNEDGEGARIIQNDQSSSIYSHIGSESTLNELPPKLLDRRGCFSPQPPPPPSIGAGPLGHFAPFSPTAAHMGLFRASENSQIQRPIPLYLSAPGAHQQIPNPTMWNTGFVPMNMDNFMAGNWLTHPAIQNSLLARQQSVSIQPDTMFCRTLPNRRNTDLNQRISRTTVMPSTTTITPTDSAAAELIMEQQKNQQDPLLLLSTNESSVGTHPANGSRIDSLLAAANRVDQVQRHTDTEGLNSDHPSALFVLKYWMAASNKPDPVRDVPISSGMQVSSKPPSSAESGRGSRPSGAGSEHSASGERKFTEVCF